MQQLRTLVRNSRPCEPENADAYAVGPDDHSKALKENADGIKFPMPILPDSKLDVFERVPYLDKSSENTARFRQRPPSSSTLKV